VVDVGVTAGVGVSVGVGEGVDVGVGEAVAVNEGVGVTDGVAVDVRFARRVGVDVPVEGVSDGRVGWHATAASPTRMRIQKTCLVLTRTAALSGEVMRSVRIEKSR
jgi:hypothetical protein